MADEKLGAWTQTALLALVCHTKKHGSEVMAKLRPNEFDGPHRDLAQAVYEYRTRYRGQPPKAAQLAMLVERLPVKEERLKAIKQLLAELSGTLKRLNKDYTVTLASEYAEKQGYKVGILKAAELVSKPIVDLVEVRKSVYEMSRYAPADVPQALNLSDAKQALQFLDKRDDGYRLGIKPLDKLDIFLQIGTMILYVGGKNSGKSWACVHAGRSALMQGANVLHVTLEMSQHQVAKRYLQSFLGVAKTYERYQYPMLSVDKKTGKAVGWSIKERTPELAIEDDDIRLKLSTAIDKWNHVFQGLRVLEYPTGAMSIGDLENYLDFLQSYDGFQPDVLIVDYPDLMKIEGREHRLALGELFKGIRGLAVKRKMASFVPTQANRIGMSASKVRGIHIGEDISKAFTADVCLTYSQTQTERTHGLARLTTEYVRDSRAGDEICIAQSYHIGQYAIKAALIDTAYREKMDGPPADVDDSEAEKTKQKQLA